MPTMPGGERQGAGHVVAVADVGDRRARPAVDAAELVGQGEQVGEGLDRVGVVGEQVHDGHARHRGHALELGVLEDPGADGGVVAAAGCG